MEENDLRTLFETRDEGEGKRGIAAENALDLDTVKRVIVARRDQIPLRRLEVRRTLGEVEIRLPVVAVTTAENPAAPLLLRRFATPIGDRELQRQHFRGVHLGEHRDGPQVAGDGRDDADGAQRGNPEEKKQFPPHTKIFPSSTIPDNVATKRTTYNDRTTALRVRI